MFGFYSTKFRYRQKIFKGDTNIIFEGGIGSLLNVG